VGDVAELMKQYSVPPRMRAEFMRGLEVEWEHAATVNYHLGTIAQIVCDHLGEDPHYYSNLRRAHREFRKNPLVLADYRSYCEDIADLYDDLPEFDEKEAWRWDVLIDHIERFYDKIRQKVDVQFVDGQPYDDAEQMRTEVASTGVLLISKEANEHPVWTPMQNLKFRAVHDYVVHIMPGKNAPDFSRRGEIRAYNLHRKLVPHDAIPALFTEVAGQACYANARGEFPVQKIAVFDNVDFYNVGEIGGEKVTRRFEAEDREMVPRKNPPLPSDFFGFDTFDTEAEDTEYIPTLRDTLQRGDVIRAGSSRWVVVRAPKGSSAIFLYKFPSKNRKMYTMFLRETGLGEDDWEIHEINGLGDNIAFIAKGHPDDITVEEGAGLVQLGDRRSNPQKRWPRGSQIQTLIFDRDMFTPAQAKNWAVDNEFKTSKVDLQPNTIRLRQIAPSRFDSRYGFRTIQITDGVQATVGVPLE
jgi:hypothetical protein